MRTFTSEYKSETAQKLSESIRSLSPENVANADLDKFGEQLNKVSDHTEISHLMTECFFAHHRCDKSPNSGWMFYKLFGNYVSKLIDKKFANQTDLTPLIKDYDSYFEDKIQNAMSRIFDKELSSIEHPITYLTRIANNEMLNMRRTVSRARTLSQVASFHNSRDGIQPPKTIHIDDIGSTQTAITGYHPLEARMDAQGVLNIIKSLVLEGDSFSDLHKGIFRMILERGEMPEYKEIAKRFGLTMGATKSSVNRLRHYIISRCPAEYKDYISSSMFSVNSTHALR